MIERFSVSWHHTHGSSVGVMYSEVMYSEVHVNMQLGLRQANAYIYVCIWGVKSQQVHGA